MIITTTKTVTKEEITKQKICDICKKDIDVSDREYIKTTTNEYSPYYHIRTINLELTTGTNYGFDGGSLEGEAIDVCFKCAKEKVMPLISKEFGIIPRIINEDW